MQNSKIEWTDDTHNFWQGCTKVSAGCANCYAEARDKRWFKGIHWGKGAPRVRSSDFYAPLKWNEQPWVCDACGLAHAMPSAICMTSGCDCETKHRRRVFSLSLGDWLDAEVPAAWLAEMLDVIRRTPNLQWILCTKRPELWSSRISQAMQFADKDWMAGKAEGRSPLGEWLGGWLEGIMPGRGMSVVPDNIIVLASVENQQQADKRIPALLNIPAAARGLSCEPLLGEVKLNQPRVTELDWLIIGGESGAGCRPCTVEWIGDLVAQCRELKIAPFVKQFGGYSITENANLNDWPDGADMEGHGEAAASARIRFQHHKGGDWNEWPEELRVREFPDFNPRPL